MLLKQSCMRLVTKNQVLMDKFAAHGGDGSSIGCTVDGDGETPSSFRGVVFVRKRVTTHVLAHVIASDPVLAPLFSTACMYAASSPATASLSVTRSAAQSHLQSFRDGSVNLLLTTVVAEEGMDVPAANCVIRFDPMEHAVSLVQGRGRARREDSSFVVLRERTDRTTAVLARAERQQLRLVQDFKPTAACAGANAALMAAQQSRERRARSVLLTVKGTSVHIINGPHGPAGGRRSPEEVSMLPLPGALSAVHIFANKTKVDLEEGWKKEAEGLWVCTLTYESPLRALHASGQAPGKKIAKRLAAAKLVAELLAVVPAT